MSSTTEADSLDAEILKDLQAAITPEPTEGEEAKQPIVTPIQAAASICVINALNANPNLREMAKRPGIAMVVEVPGAAWVNPIADVWRHLVLATERAPSDGDRNTDFYHRRRRTGERDLDWTQFTRDGSCRNHKPNVSNEYVADGLAAGKSIIGFSQSPEVYLPADLLRAADAYITIPPLDRTSVDLIVGVLAGKLPEAEIPDDVIRTLIPNDFALAWRPGMSADEFVASLIRVVGSQSKPKKVVKLSDLAGMDEAVEWGFSLAVDLSDYRVGALPWSALDRGCLLYGPPGTGKTTFAKALAASCEVPLVIGSLAAWQASGDGCLGDMLKAMRTSFEDARKQAPCILFIDELDGIGDRAKFPARHKNYSTQVINSLLQELDGVAGREGVVVIGATNDPGEIDPAILRSGRLDRMIRIPLPDEPALAKIIRHHLGNDLPDADLGGAAQLAFGHTGADVEKWVRGARRRARQQNREMVLDDLIAEIRGPVVVRDDASRRRAAVHESGHALAATIQWPGSVEKVSIRNTRAAGGFTVSRMPEDSSLTRQGVEQILIRLLAGRAAEEIVLGQVSAGSGGEVGSDLSLATSIATASISAWGFGDSLLWQGIAEPQDIPHLLATRPAVVARVSQMLAEAYQAALALLTANRKALDSLTKALLQHETLEGDQVAEIVRRALRTRRR